ncbi:HlyD family secretion protein [Kistimonas asteriae]|uniref:HlyD family secretion protein n=1 Tax=Kistimonas asteriae TaxID=517724 RepID=UPI001BAD6DA3|nr:HlyD family secretion protein [Kistimonas asteriae]
MRPWIRYATSGTLVIIAIIVLLVRYADYLVNPWTRDGQVRARVLQIAPRVSGPIISLPVTDDQYVHAGDLLFTIDPVTFQNTVAQATAEANAADVKVRLARTEYLRYRDLAQTDPGSLSEQLLTDKEDAFKLASAQYDSAKEAVVGAELNLAFTQVYAPVDGYVTNLQLSIGSQMVANQPVLALVDSATFWVTGYFRENALAGIAVGDSAIITLMSYPDQPLAATVNAIGWGIATPDGKAGYDLLPDVQANFSWIRLPQRIPVHVQLKNRPETIDLRVGATASVLVQKDTKR